MARTRRAWLQGAAVVAAASLGSAGGARAETNELRISKQPGLSYLPAVIAESLGLVEKHAKALGLNDLKVSWPKLTNGGAANDALLAGQVDLVASGGPNMLILWGRSNGEVKGVVGLGALPMFLVTNNPNVKTLADFTDQDRIALPTIKVGTQPTVLQIAVEKQFGIGALERYNAMTVSMGHPDGLIALQSKAVTAHFTQPPYQNLELKMPGVHKVLDSVEVMGGPLSNGLVYGTTKFRNANPTVIRAFVDAIKEAVEIVAADKKRAAEIYLKVNQEKVTADELVEIMNDPNAVFSATPYGMLQAAGLFKRAGYIKQDAKNWKEFFFPEVHDLPGT